MEKKRRRFKSENEECNKIAKMINKQVRDAFFKKMKELGINQSKLAELMGKSRANISVLLTQDNILTIPTIVEFCKVLGLGFDLCIKEGVDNVYNNVSQTE
jgi:transcriptional regulator